MRIRNVFTFGRSPRVPIYSGGVPSGVDANDGAMRTRAVFYARCSVLEDLAYGRTTVRREYIEKSLVALGSLFGSNACAPLSGVV